MRITFAESHAELDKCAQFISSQGLCPRGSRNKSNPPRLAITISRQSGSGARFVADCLAKKFQARTSAESPAWTVFERNLVERVLEEHDLPGNLAPVMREDAVPELADALDELLAGHPPAWTFVQHTVQTILRLAERGNAILIGRGAHLVTRSLPHVFHVRLVGSLEKRVEHLREMRALSEKQAVAIIRREDRGCRRYLKKYFHGDIDDPLAYHLVVNTDSMSYEKIAHVIEEAALESVSAA